MPPVRSYTPVAPDDGGKYLKASVTYTDTLDPDQTASGTIYVGDPGTVSFSANPPPVDTVLTATLLDADDPLTVPAPVWRWFRSARPDSGFAAITGADSASYTPSAADTAFFLRAEVDYSDGTGSGKTASAITALPVGVATGVLVKNTRQPSTACNANRGSAGILYQGFATGDNPAGYLLELAAVNLLANGGQPITVQLYKRESGSGVGQFVYEMQPPGTIQQEGGHSVAAPPGTVLEPSSVYYLRLSNTQFYSCRGGGLATDINVLASGWSVFAGVITRDGNDSNSNNFDALRIVVRGLDLLGPPGPPLTLSATAGERSAALSWSEPGSTGQRSVMKYQMRYKVGNAAFGAWSDVPDSDADSDLADERSVTVSGLTAAAVHTFEVRAVNSRGDGTEAQATATPLNSPPVFPDSDSNGTADPVARSLAENTSGGLGLAITATDDDSDTLTYSVVATTDTDGADHLAAFNKDFDLNTGSGQISVKSGVTIDFETRESYKVLYQVTDSKDVLGTADAVIDDELTLTITVINVNEPGVVTIGGTVQVGKVLTATLTDPDLPVSGEMWQWSKSATAGGTFTAISNTNSVSYTPVVADEGMFLRASVSYTDGFGSGRTAAGTISSPVLAAAAVHTVPVFSDGDGDGMADPVARSLAENTASGDSWGRLSPRPMVTATHSRIRWRRPPIPTRRRI